MIGGVDLNRDRVAKGGFAGYDGVQALMSKLDQHDKQEEPAEPANVKVAKEISERALNHHMTGDEKRLRARSYTTRWGGEARIATSALTIRFRSR